MAEAEFVDPVCGMSVRPDGPHHCEHEGRTYRFCNPRCLQKFQLEPERYLTPKPAAEPSAAEAAATYTCPMHPEVRQRGPGSCPICGMALEPVVATAETGPSHERRFTVEVLFGDTPLAQGTGQSKRAAEQEAAQAALARLDQEQEPPTAGPT